MNIGIGIKVRRKQIKMKQKDLAKLSGISVTSLVAIEKGSSQPKKATLEVIASILGVPVFWLVFYSLEESDVPEENRKLFLVLTNALLGVFAPDDQDIRVGPFVDSPFVGSDGYVASKITRDEFGRGDSMVDCGVSLDHLKDLQACTAAGDRWSSSDLVSGIPGESNLSVVRYDDNGDVVKPAEQ